MSHDFWGFAMEQWRQNMWVFYRNANLTVYMEVWLGLWGKHTERFQRLWLSGIAGNVSDQLVLHRNSRCANNGSLSTPSWAELPCSRIKFCKQTVCVKKRQKEMVLQRCFKYLRRKKREECWVLTGCVSWSTVGLLSGGEWRRWTNVGE